MTTYTPKAKKTLVEPITITIVIKAHRINEEGTFLKWETVKVSTSGKCGAKVVAPPQGGGALYIRALSTEGLAYAKDEDAAKPAGQKFF